MVDHPLVSTQLRQYIQKNKIEELMNEGLNIVMAQLPQDPYSTMATTLINVSIFKLAPIFITTFITCL